MYGIIRNELLISQKTLNKLLNKGFIYINNSLVGAPVLFVKKEGGFRFSVDYRGLNNITRKDHYPLLLIKEILSGISKVKYFIKLNITVVFYKIRITKG